MPNPNNELLSVQTATQSSQVPRWDQMNSAASAAAITVTASPFVYTNVSAGHQEVLISGGTVTTVEYSRDGGTTYLVVGLLAGQFHLSPNDKLRVTYALAPTMTSIPF